MNHVTAGQRIKALRTERKITQEKLAQQAGISVGFLSDLENDKTNVGADKLLDIAESLDVSLDYLMKGAGATQAPKQVALELPASLVRLADRVGLTVTQARQLMGMRQQLLGFRSDTKNTDLENFDWEKLHTSVKEFLK